jgi:hypothetical protein
MTNSRELDTTDVSGAENVRGVEFTAVSGGSDGGARGRAMMWAWDRCG